MRSKNNRLDPIALALRELRYQRGIRQRELADRMGYSRRTLSQVECGNVTPDLFFVKTWAQALGYRLELTEIKCST